MSVIINNMAMPQNCYECRFCETYLGHHHCVAYLNYIEDPRSGRLDTCPLIPVPDHGDLIDRDALMAKYAEEVAPSNNSDFIRPPRWNDAVELTELAPTVVPAERRD